MLPTFLGIGAQKSGTTWLDANLRSHPKIWLPPTKELHFFDTRDLPGSRRRRVRVLRAQRRAYWQGRLAEDLLDGDLGGLAWHANYFGRPRNERWYASLFPDDPDLVAGEITPAYGILSSDQVERIARLLPDVRIVFMMREPVSRAWSQVRMMFQNQGGRFRGTRWNTLSEVPITELKHVVDAEPFRLRGDYARTLRTWAGHFPRESLFVGFLEEIERNPDQFLDRLAEHLGVEPLREWPLAHAVMHKGTSTPIPRDLAAYLEERQVFQLEELRELLLRLDLPLPHWSAPVTTEAVETTRA